MTDIISGNCNTGDLALYPNSVEMRDITDRMAKLEEDLLRAPRALSGVERFRTKRHLDQITSEVEKETFFRAEPSEVLKHLWEQAGNQWTELLDNLHAVVEGGPARAAAVKVKKEADTVVCKENRGGKGHDQRKKVTFAWDDEESPTPNSGDKEGFISNSTAASPAKSNIRPGRKQSRFPAPWDLPLAGEPQTFSGFTDSLRPRRHCQEGHRPHQGEGGGARGRSPVPPVLKSPTLT